MGLLTGSLLVASILGSLTDILPVFLQIRTPQFSPIFVLFPLAAISYSVKYHGFMQPEAKNLNELILQESAYTNVYRYIGFMFVVGSILNLVLRLIFQKASLPSVLPSSGAFLAIAAFILLINRTKLDDTMKEMLLAAAVSFTIPVVTLWFVKSGSTTIWGFVFLLMIICLLFNRRTILMTVIISSMLTQALIWAAAPTVSIQINEAYYIVRIGLIGFAAILSLHVNKVYVQRLKENAQQISMQTLVSETSRDFVSANEQNFDKKVYKMLSRCGSFIKSDRAYVALIDPNEKSIRNSFEWVAEGVSPQSDLLEESVCELFKQFESKNIVVLHDTKLMPTTEKLQNQLICRNIRAFLALPVKKQDVIIGFLAFTAAQPLTQWGSESFTYLEIITNIFADATIKIDAEKEINFIAYHDHLTLLPNRALFMGRLEKAITQAGTEKNFALAFLDLDSFKFVNDTMGHELGDQLLFEVAQVLTGVIRSSDTISRFGGDEFIILFNDITNEKDLASIMDKIMDALRRPILLNGREFYISASVGIAMYPRDGTDAKTLIADADIAMYKAKTRGKNQYLFCSRVIKDQALKNGS